MVKQNLVNRRRGRPKGSKNKKAAVKQVVPTSRFSKNDRYVLRSRVEKNILDADQEYYFIFDIKKGDLYPEIIAQFTVETEANLCVEFLNGIRKISEKEYNKKRVYIPQE